MLKSVTMFWFSPVTSFLIQSNLENQCHLFPSDTVYTDVTQPRVKIKLFTLISEWKLHTYQKHRQRTELRRPASASQGSLLAERHCVSDTSYIKATLLALKEITERKLSNCDTHAALAPGKRAVYGTGQRCELHLGFLTPFTGIP